MESSKSRRIFASLKTTSTNTNKIYSIMQPQNYVMCVLAHCPTERYPHLSEEVIKKWDDDFMMKVLLDIANEFYHIGYMTNDDGQAYGVRYAPNLPEPCLNALKWAYSTDQSSRLWSQWTTKEV